MKIIDSPIQDKTKYDRGMVGKLVIFTECNGFMILEDEELFHAVQVLNNGNNTIGYIDYSDSNMEDLMETLINEYVNIQKIVNLKDINISFN